MLVSVALQRTAMVAVKHEARAFSTVASTFGRAAAAKTSASTMAHACGPNCSHCNCASAFCVHKTSNRSFFSLFSTEAHGMDTSTPDKCISALEEGNARFVKGDIIAPNRNMERVKELAGGQAPFAAFLSCADSRVPVEMIFDQGFGDVFICRVAGNIVNTETIGSLEFGCAVLGAKVLYVLGHSSCGAVKATIAGAPVPGVISSLYYGIQAGCEAGHGDLEKSIAENVKVQVKQLQTSPVLKDLEATGKLKIIGGVYDLATGKVNRVC